MVITKSNLNVFVNTGLFGDTQIFTRYTNRQYEHLSPWSHLCEPQNQLLHTKVKYTY
jgi:hypothetical protein